MPIDLSDLSQNTNIKAFTPKYFEKTLTGSGKKAGLLSIDLDPAILISNPNTKLNTTPRDAYFHKHTSHQGPDIKILRIPFAPVNTRLLSEVADLEFPTYKDNTLIASKNINGFDLEIRLKIEAEQLTCTELTKETLSDTGNKKTTYEKSPIVTYRITAFIAQATQIQNNVFQNNTRLYANNIIDFHNYDQNKITPTFALFRTENLADSLMTILKQLKDLNFSIDSDIFDNILIETKAYDKICEQSEIWQESITTDLILFFEAIHREYKSNPSNQIVLNAIVKEIRYIENYAVSLEQYEKIYDSLASLFSEEIISILCKQNVNLLLTNTLKSLAKKKSLLNKVNAHTMTNPPKFFSKEQKEATTTESPLALIQAGAGTGKSTVILARIDYMVDAGINPKDITVLSFTNAAADNITQKNPHVNSMTIAKMVHSIYSHNYPQHELSSIETIINSLEIYYPNNETAFRLRTNLKDLSKNNSNAYSAMNVFMENNFDEIMQMLDTLKQTSLEIEIMVCYQKIDSLIIPTPLTTEHLIIDEVQDNSIFEFIYSLKYVNKYETSLFIVGDCSQTLYEFRASNPKALNSLEASGVFDSYKLQTNYRSNQEILDFANISLSNIEANQYANIQLQANSLQKVTADTFKSKVNTYHAKLHKLNDFNENIGPIMKTNMSDWIDDALQKGEQVAFLAYTRKNIQAAEEALISMYPDKKIINLIPKRVYSSTIFSTFIKKYWDEVNFHPSHEITKNIIQTIYARIGNIVYNPAKSTPLVQKHIAGWLAENTNSIKNSYQKYASKLITLEEHLTMIKESMLKYEIKNNIVKQAVLSSQNEENKKKDYIQGADIILSTIHSAKGLEFDHVCVFHKEGKGELSEEDKRMYYVAYTRAMKSEFILSYSTKHESNVETTHRLIIDSLEKKQSSAIII